MCILMESREGSVAAGAGRGTGRAMGNLYSETLHTIAFKTRETDFGSIIQPVPITIKTYNVSNGVGGYSLPATAVVTSLAAAPRLPRGGPSTSAAVTSPVKEEDASKLTRAPPKKKWIREYLEEEPQSPVSLRVVSVCPARAPSPAPPAPAPAEPAAAAATAATAAPLPDVAQEHSRPRTTSATSHGPAQIPSPPSVGSSGSASSGSAPRAGTREVHNKLEKNRRAHLKECFELLKRQLPATPDDKKTSNLSILGSAIRYIQVLRRKERECEHEMERLAREKIAAQQRLAALRRDVGARPAATAAAAAARLAAAAAHPCAPETVPDDKDSPESVNGHVLGISVGGSPPAPRTLSLSTALRALPVITPTTSQGGAREALAARHSTLTLTTLAHHKVNENGLSNGLSTLVHPAQIHLPISQVVGAGGAGAGLVVSPATLQLLSAGAGLRVIPAHHNGVSAADSSRLAKSESGLLAPRPPATEGAAPAHVVHAHAHAHAHTHARALHHKAAEGGVVSAQYLTTTIVKPVVVVSSAHTT